MNHLLAAVADRDNLTDAWHQVRRKQSAPGVDGVTVADFAKGQDSHLRDLGQDLRYGVYQSQPLRGTYIPKSLGGWRALGIPTVRDRVAQRACLNVLVPRLEPEWEDCSYAYRPGRSIYGAIMRLESWRDRGYDVLLDADIEHCFDSIDRALLLDKLAAYIAAPEIIDLVQRWLEAGVVWPGKKNAPVAGPVLAPLGIPQGDIISPLLCNLFLDEFDEALLGQGYKLVRYADDFVIVATHWAQAEAAREAAGAALAALHLRLHGGKTHITTFARGFKYLGAVFKDELILPTLPRRGAGPPGQEGIVFVPGYDNGPRRRAGRERVPLITGPGPRAVLSSVEALRTQRRLDAPVAAALVRALGQRQARSRPRTGRKSKGAKPTWETTYLLLEETSVTTLTSPEAKKGGG